VIEPTEIDTGSVARCTHLLKRLNVTPESGYQDFKNTEETFSNMQPRRLSLLTERLLRSVDYDACKKQRSTNFQFLNEKLKHLNNLNIDTAHIDGPMCYPLMISDTTVRGRLLTNRVFAPTYWPEVANRAKPDSFEQSLLEKCLPLPCDQRYTQDDMARIVELVKGIK
jgi:hypothetical protein